MSDNYSLYWRLEANIDGFQKNLSKAQKSLSGFQGAFQKLQKFTVAGIVGTAGLKAIRELKKVIDETTAAYRTQINAENALAVALKNNIKTSELSAKAMKDYASALSNASNYGDEELLPMISKLIASGRTEAEAMKIMSAAVDMAAGANMSLDSAVEQLNGTINGNIGRLGRQNAELKNLTAEELASGKAVDILAKKYEGMAKKTQDSSKLLKNAIGDYKEELGAGFEKALAPMRSFFAELLGNHAKALKEARLLKNAEKGIFEATPEELQIVIDSAQKKLKAFNTEIKAIRTTMLPGKPLDIIDRERLAYLTQTGIPELNRQIGEAKKQLNEIANAEKDAKKAEAELLAKAEEEKKQQNLIDLQKKYLDMIAEQEQAWKNSLEVKGENVAVEEKIAFYQEKLLDIMLESNGEINAGTAYYQNQMSIIDGLSGSLETHVKKVSDWDEKLLKQRKDSLNETSKEYHKLTQLIITVEHRKVLATEESEEERKKITEYYENELIKENERFENVKRNQTKETLKKVTEYMNASLKALKQMLSTAINTIKSVFSSIKSLVSVNFDDLLDNILAFEDSVLTFFLETLPKLPSYLSSILQSILTLVNTLFDSIDVKQLTNIISEMVKMLAENVPQIISKIASIAVTIITAFSNALIENLPIIANGLKTIREDLIPKLQTMLHTIIITIGETLKSLLPEAVMFIVDFIAMLLKELPSLLKVIIEAIPVLVQSILEAIPKFFEEDFPTIIAEFMKLIPTLIKVAVQISLEIIKELPHIVASIISGLVKAFIEIDWWQLIVDIFTGFVDAIKSFFGIHSPSTLFAEFGGYMIKGMWEGLKNMGSWLISNVTSFFQNVWSSIKNVFSGAGDWFGNLFGNIGNSLSNWASSTWEATKNIASGVATGASNLVSGAVQGIKNVASNVGSTIGNVASTVGNFITGLKFWASGTNNAPKGLAIVGEAGPELVNFRGGEQVLNAGNTQKALNSGTHENVFNVTFNNLQDTTAFQMMSQLKQYQRNLAFSGVL